MDVSSDVLTASRAAEDVVIAQSGSVLFFLFCLFFLFFLLAIFSAFNCASRGFVHN